MNSSRSKLAMEQADAFALGRMLAVRPMLCGVVRARDVMGFTRRTLLHAGPPIDDPRVMAMPVRHSAIMAILYEGWADTRGAAAHLLDSGQVALHPAQDHGAAIPLADVLSPGMPLLEVRDAHDPVARTYSTVNGGNGPVMRVGLCDDEVLERLHWVDRVLAPQLARVLAGAAKQDAAARGPSSPAAGLDMIDLADRALLEGDDCHGRTACGSRHLLASLLRLGGPDAFTPDVRDFLENAPAFFLNPWMAAVKLILWAAEGIPGSGVVTAMGGNGRRFGIRIASAAGRWFVTEASPPLIPGRADLLDASAGVIGDSAIVDGFGGGAMASLAYAPETRTRMEQVCVEHGLPLPSGLLATAHPAFVRASAFRTGLSLGRIRAAARTPVISLGVLDRSGARGRFDGGFYFSPAAVFEQAWETLEVEHAGA